MNKVKIKTGDTVKVLSGKYRGKTGKVIRVIPEKTLLVVENVNLLTRFEKSRKAGQPGKKVTFPAPMPVGKVMLMDPHSGKSSRLGFTFLENGSKQRIARKSKKPV